MANNTGQKFGGREAGTPNRLTKEIRIHLKNFLHNEIESLGEYLKDLEPKDKLDILIKLMPFVLPKVNEVNHNVNEPISWDL
ncbi:MAG: hypothetical protein NTW25_11505 [Candidatus Kapabacteria bacterium]|nr:hypothetical protein [Candidatus Kapabacteria bacterium]